MEKQVGQHKLEEDIGKIDPLKQYERICVFVILSFQLVKSHQ